MVSGATNEVTTATTGAAAGTVAPTVLTTGVTKGVTKGVTTGVTKGVTTGEITGVTKEVTGAKGSPAGDGAGAWAVDGGEVSVGPDEDDPVGEIEAASAAPFDSALVVTGSGSGIVLVTGANPRADPARPARRIDPADTGAPAAATVGPWSPTGVGRSVAPAPGDALAGALAGEATGFGWPPGPRTLTSPTARAAVPTLMTAAAARRRRCVIEVCPAATGVAGGTSGPAGDVPLLRSFPN
jgi:hypothetical protein